MSAQQIICTDSHDNEVKKLPVWLGDGSERMLYTGQVVLHSGSPEEPKKKNKKSSRQTRQSKSVSARSSPCKTACQFGPDVQFCPFVLPRASAAANEANAEGSASGAIGAGPNRQVHSRSGPIGLTETFSPIRSIAIATITTRTNRERNSSEDVESVNDKPDNPSITALPTGPSPTNSLTNNALSTSTNKNNSDGVIDSSSFKVNLESHKLLESSGYSKDRVMSRNCRGSTQEAFRGKAVTKEDKYSGEVGADRQTEYTGGGGATGEKSSSCGSTKIQCNFKENADENDNVNSQKRSGPLADTFSSELENNFDIARTPHSPLRQTIMAGGACSTQLDHNTPIQVIKDINNCETIANRVTRQDDLKGNSSDNSSLMKKKSLGLNIGKAVTKSQREAIPSQTDHRKEISISSVIGKTTFGGQIGNENEAAQGDRSHKRSKSHFQRRKLPDDIHAAELHQTLMNAQKYCYQVQRSLFHTLLNEVKSSESYLKNDGDKSVSESLTDNLKLLTFLLESLIKLSYIQVGINSSLQVMSIGDCSIQNGDCDNEETFHPNMGLHKEDKDDLLVECRSLMNRTKLSKCLVCIHLTNPYSTDLRYSCGDDRVWSNAVENGFLIHLPHGQGKLESLSTNLIYEGQWKYGKRWGYGKAFILSGAELSASQNQFAIYQGSWWNNMRHGNGHLVLASGSEYNGEWHYDLKSGMGTMTYPDGSTFEGVWDENELDGCGLFTWSNGTLECREYRKGQVIRVIDYQGKLPKISSYNKSLRDYSVLRLKYQAISEDKAQLLHSNSSLREMVDQQANELLTVEEKLTKLHEAKLKHLRQDCRKMLYSRKMEIEQQHQIELGLNGENYEAKIKELQDNIGNILKELEVKKAASVCQICFDRERDCMLMPCTHMLYCRVCISKEKEEGRNRCPACRGAISGEVNCNISP